MGWLRTAVLAAALAAVAGCSSMPCTAVGCVSVATVRIHGLTGSAPRHPVKVRSCFDRRCVRLTLRSDGTVACAGGGRHVCDDERKTHGYLAIVFRQVPAGRQPHSVTLTARDANGAVVARGARTMRLEKNAPNGERCGPVCWDGTTGLRLGQSVRTRA